MNPTQRYSRESITPSSRSLLATSLALVSLCGLCSFSARAQAPSALYTWDNTGNAAPNIESWAKNFGANTVTLDNSIFGELRITETGGAGADVAISDGGNRVRESATSGSGGTDITGLSYLEWVMGHNGSGNINVQFFVQASTGYNYVSLGNVAVTPGISTYQLSLAGLTPAQAVYVRTFGFNAGNHAGIGDVVWTVREVRTVNQTLTSRTLITHNAGTGDGGLQGAIVNFDNGAVLGNNGGQNQTGLSWNSAGSGSLRWTDLGGQQGAAMSWGNGTAWNSSTFNNRETDLSNYDKMIVTISATDPNSGGGTLGFNAFFQVNNFSFQSAEGGAGKSVPIDGLFHDVEFSLAGLANMNAIDLTGINLFAHSQDLVIDVDNIRFEVVPEPHSAILLLGGILGLGLAARRNKRSSLKG